MNTHADKASKNKGQVIANGLSKLRQGESKSPFQFADNRPEAVAQRKLQELADNSQQVSRLRALQQLANASPHVSQLKSLQELANNSPQVKQAAQLQALSSAKAPSPIQQEIASGIAQLAQVPEEKELIQAKPQTAQRQPNESDSKPRQNNTGLPDKLKAGIESLSGMSLDHVKVHYNSAQPAQLNALAYAQGSDIHVAPGQEQHLPHEAWHIVQQAQGRVQPTMQMKDGVAINDDAGLEREATRMGEAALSILEKIPGSDGFYDVSQIISIAHDKGCGCPGCGGRAKGNKLSTGAITAESIQVPVQRVTGEIKATHRTVQLKPCAQHNKEDCKICKVNKSNKNHNPKAGITGGGMSAKDAVALDAGYLEEKKPGLSRPEYRRQKRYENKK